MPAVDGIDVQHLDVNDVHLYHRNPRRGDVDAVAESLRVNGQYRAIVVNRGTHTGRPMEVLAGNHTLKAARQLGWETIAAHVIDVDDDQAARIVIADNRTSDLAETDTAVVAELLDGLDDLTGTGYDVDDLETMLNDLLPDAPEPEAEPIYTQDVNIPQYTPTMDTPPAVGTLRDTTKRDALISDIEAADIPPDVKALLTDAAHRHTVFNYRLIAEYYAHAPADVQRLMEASALVIIDPQNAIRNGYMKLTKELEELYEHETGA